MTTIRQKKARVDSRNNKSKGRTPTQFEADREDTNAEFGARGSVDELCEGIRSDVGELDVLDWINRQ